jgi:hypothetical protein
MSKLASIAIISTFIAMSGCAVDAMEAQEEEPSVETIESELNGSVWLSCCGRYYSYYTWNICSTYGNWAYRRVVYVNGAVNGCRAIPPKACTLTDYTLVQPWYLIGC